MSRTFDRRNFLKLTGAGTIGLGLLNRSGTDTISGTDPAPVGPKNSERRIHGTVGIPGEPFVRHRSWNAEELWGDSTSLDMNLCGDEVALDDHILIEDDAPGIGAVQDEVWETIEPGTLLRKELLVERWPVRHASVVLMVYPLEPAEPYSGARLHVSVNGHEPLVHEVGHVWCSIPVPDGQLQNGRNRIEVTVDGENTRFRMPVALASNYSHGSDSRLAPDPQRSRKSNDGGSTWSEGLTPSGTRRGEYPIRLKLRASRPEGWIRTPVIDLADLEGPLLFPLTIRSARIDMESNTRRHGRLVLHARAGDTHRPETGGWTEWRRVEGNRLPDELLKRFLQLRIDASSGSGTETPGIRRLAIESRVEPRNDSPSVHHVYSLNRPTVERSFDFVHEDPTYSRLRSFRQNYGLDRVVEGARTEMEKILKLRGWTARQWEWFMPDTEQESFVEWDSRRILAPDIGGFCLYYAILFAQACQSYGIPSRIVTINFSVWGGHEVTEVWSRDYNKWIMIDPQFDTMFVRKKDGLPLGTIELHRIFLETYYPGGEVIDRDTWTFDDRDRRSHSIDPDSLPIRMEIGGNALSGRLGEEYIWWKVAEDEPAPGYRGGYGFFNTAYVRWLPRSNWMSRPRPMPIDHGRTHWGWDGYLCWAGEQAPETPEHRHFVRRERDMYGFYYGVDFSAEPAGDGNLRIRMTTDSPGFSHFELIDNRRTVETESSRWDWELAPGMNRLVIRSVDLLGNRGPDSELRVNYLPA